MSEIASNGSLKIDGRVVFLTGALGLLGKAYCRGLSEAGAHVVVTDLDENRCIELSDTLSGDSLGIRCDVTNRSSIEAAKDEVIKRFGTIDTLINNAAINEKIEDVGDSAMRGRFEDLSLEQWQAIMDVNVTGVFQCCQAIGSEMASRGSGNIINIASTYGIVAPDQSLYQNKRGEQRFFKSPAYPTSKAAVIQLTRYLAAYWGSSGVRVNALSPGGVENDQDPDFVVNYATRTPLGRMACPDDYIGALQFLASNASSYMTGANLVVDGGWTIC